MKNLWVENFSYETVNRFKAKFQSFGSQSYSYDLSGQLTGVTGSENETFTYDSLGNRITDQNGNYVYDPSGQRLTEDYQFIYNYDLNGNLIQIFPNDQSKEAYTYSYSSKNQLINVNVLENALGQVKRKVSFKYDVFAVEVQSAGVVVQRYEYSSFGKLQSIKVLAGNDISVNPVVRTYYTDTGREYDAETGLYFYLKLFQRVEKNSCKILRRKLKS